MHTLHTVSPAWSPYFPLGQPIQAPLDEVEYLPTVHTVQVDAPTIEPVFVTEPAAQVMHSATSDTVEYSPAAHSSHELAPSAVPVSVSEPASQTLQ